MIPDSGLAAPASGGFDDGQRCRDMRFRVLVVMNEPASIDAEQDTTMALVDEMRGRGHTVQMCLAGGLGLGRNGLHARLCSGRVEPVEDFDAVLVRTDPPFDVPYLHATLLLEHVRGRCLLVNDPRALRDFNEKLYPLRFPHLAPPTIVSSELEELLEFIDQQGGRMVVKPVDGCGGHGIFVADRADANLHAILETVTNDGSARVIAQRYLPSAITTGDKRIILLDGQPIGAFLRRPADGHARANLHAGGSATAAELDARELEIVSEVGAHCRSVGLMLVGLDVIGGWLTEVNVTSPAGFRTLTRLTGVHLEATVVDWLERNCQSRSLTHDADRMLIAAA